MPIWHIASSCRQQHLCLTPVALFSEHSDGATGACEILAYTRVQGCATAVQGFDFATSLRFCTLLTPLSISDSLRVLDIVSGAPYSTSSGHIAHHTNPLCPPQPIHDCYKFEEELGRGKFGITCRVH